MAPIATHPRLDARSCFACALAAALASEIIHKIGNPNDWEISETDLAIMKSARQLAANRANAQRSTGPKTIAGKKRSRMNSLKHGLTAKTLVLRNEDPAELELVYSELVEELLPQTVPEQELVGRV